MVKICLMHKTPGYDVGLNCSGCDKPIGIRACVRIVDKDDNSKWLCPDCIIITDGEKVVFPCSE